MVGDSGSEGEAVPEERPARGFAFVDAGRGTSGAEAVLSTWSVLEALSPRSYGEPRDFLDGSCDLAWISAKELPWPDFEEPRKGYAFYYRVDLGGLDLRRVSGAILDAYGRDEGVVSSMRDHALLGMVLVDSKGVPIPRASSVSSFGWALPLVLGKNLGRMTRWGDVEQDVLADLSEILAPDGEDATPPTLTWERILAAHEWLVERFGIPRDFVLPPSFSLRIEHRAKSGSLPAPFILNSFYLNDIDRAIGLVEAGTAPPSLRAYLGLDVPARPIDVLKGHGALRHLLAPGNTPAARWPAPGGHPLVTLQQAAVNAASAGLGDTAGVLSANGPPGTGKTTLTRDVAADCILRRAAAMAAFDDPEDAFSRPEDEARQSGRRLFALHPSLKGHEILVASSNNKAVENISRELPLMRSVEPGSDGPPRHFRATADHVAGNMDEHGGLRDPDRACWGLASAVLGNAGNRAAFVSRFWWNDDYGIRTCLRLARGEDVQVPVLDKDRKPIGSRPPHVLRLEDPPRGKAAALRRWRAARDAFDARLAQVLDEIDDLTRFDQALRDLPDLRDAAERAEAALDALERAARPVDALASRFAQARDDLDALEGGLERHRATEPRRPADGGGRASWDIWDAEREEIEHRVEGAVRTLRRLESALANERVEAGDDGGILAARTDVAAARAGVAEALGTLARVRAGGEPERVDAAFFERGHEAWNLASPWIPARVQALRSELFGLAMGVHEAFVMAAARPMLANLGGFVDLTGNSAPSAELTAQAPDLWSTLFLAVPVVSTTFASAGRMLNAVPPGTLGWLLVDEAGQATPQAAVGTVTKFRRVLAVGDPLQVEPVVTLPRRLASRICDHFKVAPEEWTAPAASVQSLADRASPLKATYDTVDGVREVGMPLLVHRRCAEPMFGIANRIAYAGQMVHAAGAADGEVVGRIGPSAWFDVDGPHDGKWCKAAGDAVVALLARAARDADGNAAPGGPDVYVISPFRDVANSLRSRLRTEPRIFPGTDMRAWAEQRVGTIHTFQGREAESVILVLGAGAPAHAGARGWAGRTPNIANVAVTRAKRSLYVVGSRSAWESSGAFAAVAEALPIAPVPKAPIGSLRDPPPAPRIGRAPRAGSEAAAPTPPPSGGARAVALPPEPFEDLLRLG